MKKILFISNTANFSKFNRPYMRWFREQGWQVDYCSAGEEAVLDCDRQFSITMARSPFSIGNLKAYRELERLLRENDYDILHCHTPMGGALGRFAARRLRRKEHLRVIYTAHGFHFYDGAPLVNWLLYYPVEKFLSRLTDAIITINKEDYERAKKKFRCAVEYVAGVGVDLKKFVPAAESEKLAARASLSLSPEDFVITVVAECNANKNQLMLIRNIPLLLRSIPNLKVLLVGKETLPDARNAVDALHLNECVRFLGYRNDVEKITSASDIAFSASLREGLPVNIIEAMACGVPAVCSHNRGHDSLVSDGETGILFSPDDDAEMVSALVRLYEDAPLRAAMGRNSVGACERYALDKVLSDMIDIYKRYILSCGKGEH